MPRQATWTNMIAGMFEVWVKDLGWYFLVFLVLSLVTGGLTLAGSYLILHVPVVSTGTFSLITPTVTDALAYVAYQLVVAGVTWLFTSMVLGGVVDFAIRRYRGESVRMTDSLSRGIGRVLSIMGANLLVSLIVVAIVLLWAVALVVGAIGLIGGGSLAAGIALVCGLVAALPVVLFFVLYLAIALCLYAPAIMMEGAHAVDSLGRSWNLTRGHKWSIFGAGLVVGLVLVILDGAIRGAANAAGNPIVSLIGAAIATGLTGGWFAILTAVAYDLITKTPQPSQWPPTYTPMGPPR